MIHYLLLTISYDKLTLNMGNVRKCLYLYPVIENKLKKKIMIFTRLKKPIKIKKKDKYINSSKSLHKSEKRNTENTYFEDRLYHYYFTFPL